MKYSKTLGIFLIIIMCSFITNPLSLNASNSGERKVTQLITTTKISENYGVVKFIEKDTQLMYINETETDTGIYTSSKKMFVFDVSTGKKIKEEEVGFEPILSVSGRYIVSSEKKYANKNFQNQFGEPPFIKIYDTQTGLSSQFSTESSEKLLGVLEDEDQVYAVSLSGDENRVEIRYYNRSGDYEYNLMLPLEHYRTIQMLANGNILFATTKHVGTIDYKTGKIYQSVLNSNHNLQYIVNSDSNPYYITVFGNFAMLPYATKDLKEHGNLFYDIKNNKLLSAIKLPMKNGTKFTQFGTDMTPSGLFIGSYGDKSMRVYNIKTGQLISTFFYKDNIDLIKLSKDGKKLFATMRGDKEYTTSVINPQTGKIIKTIKSFGMIEGMSESGKYVLVSDKEYRIADLIVKYPKKRSIWDISKM
ncbi:YncE family protein [Paenibacillus odorifer]|uniref:WD40 repeat domain-containing protein n=1 Tax=Paenibacillus odorifer TaxID=189426 RepID=A0A1R0Y9H0_9BACL|nr:hypothetical protein [Paenibacillus odorifer]OMD44028.1 hypothetical protein BSK52_00310 [Paenibacillus odorifer]